MIALSTDALLGAGAVLGPRERATHAELARLDRRLASLFLAGHELARRVLEDDGAVYLLAHTGRELSRGVVRALLGDEAPMPPADADADELPETEGNRRSIGVVLGRPTTHAAVTSWFRLVQTFSKSCHLYLEVPPPDGAKVARAFVTLSDLLYGRVAPYFATAAELDALLAIAEPTNADVARAEPLLARVQQRRYFFSNLEHPAWVAPLAVRGHFASPPDRVVHADGSWQARAWPEGDFLARMAPRAPDAVTEQLLRVPDALANPAVWGVVTDAALALPTVQAARLAPRVAKALATVSSMLLPRKVVDLAGRLAAERDPTAWKLADALLWGRAERDATPGSGSDVGGWTGQRRRANEAFARLDPYQLRRLCAEALPAFERFDPDRTLGLVLGRLAGTLRFVRAGSPNDAGAGDAGEDHSSQWWCESFDAAGDDDDVRAVLAAAAARVALALSRQGPVGAQSAWAQLQRQTGDVFERLKLWVLTHAGEHLPQELDAVVGGDALLDPPYGAREAAALLRSRFAHASPGARALFRCALERGPSAADVQASVSWRRRFRDDDEGDGPNQGGKSDEHTEPPSLAPADALADAPPSPAEIEAAIRTWQAQRLRWFHNRLPDELRDLAERAGVRGDVPAEEQQDLDEVGFHSYGVTSWGGPVSPRSADELAAMLPSELLGDWRPDEPGRDAFSYRGLEDALTMYALEHPAPAAQVLEAATASPLRPAYLAALLSGLGTAAVEGRVVPWADVLRAAGRVVGAADRARPTAGKGPSDPPAGPQGGEAVAWGTAVRAAASFVQTVCAKDLPPREASTDVWRTLSALVHSPTVRSDTSGLAGTIGFERALVDALNTAGGESARALVDAGLWEYRAAKRASAPDAQDEGALPGVEALMAPLLAALLAHDGEGPRAAQTMFGQFAPQLTLLAPGWFASAEERLFAGGAEEPLAHPAWGAYVLRARLHGPTFRQLRRWYVRAAQVASPEVSAEGGADSRREWSVTRGLASHVLTAVVWGLAAIGDEDALVETTFTRVPAVDRARVYWAVFRAWSNAKEAPPPAYAEGVVRFWEWRLTELDAAAPSRAREEEAEGLLWLFKMPHLPAQDAVRLGRRTLRLSTPNERRGAGAWTRLQALIGADVAGAFDVAELLVGDGLARQNAYFPFDEVAPILRVALGAGDAGVRARAEQLVHRLGEAGHLEYGCLLRERDGARAAAG